MLGILSVQLSIFSFIITYIGHVSKEEIPVILGGKHKISKSVKKADPLQRRTVLALHIVGMTTCLLSVLYINH